ncbi:hypothetical protein JOL79_06340 [Microbispora sp. RL4-1S]|uniref:Aminotransferase class I/II-fold pyridoxal phosphate-dependent enzyme n=1 Tax=Microbispora oryzae TaxID=2806554 RepID=A0A940WHQ5_9ACTN|nr:hypothetical protein [Microbispora oryzae]MBP2703417.1 hypothetical protein [Microbispora oryzae]
MTRPITRLRRAAAEREAAGLRRALCPRAPGHDGLLDLASNDYLGLSRDERLVEAAVRTRAAEVAAIIRELGLTGVPAAAVVPVVLGPARAAVEAAAPCADLGVRVGCFRPPSVPDGRSCLRLTARADLRSDDLAAVRNALTAVAKAKVDR